MEEVLDRVRILELKVIDLEKKLNMPPTISPSGVKVDSTVIISSSLSVNRDIAQAPPRKPEEFVKVEVIDWLWDKDVLNMSDELIYKLWAVAGFDQYYSKKSLNWWAGLPVPVDVARMGLYGLQVGVILDARLNDVSGFQKELARVLSKLKQWQYLFLWKMIEGIINYKDSFSIMPSGKIHLIFDIPPPDVLSLIIKRFGYAVNVGLSGISLGQLRAYFNTTASDGGTYISSLDEKSQKRLFEIHEQYYIVKGDLSSGQLKPLPSLPLPQ